MHNSRTIHAAKTEGKNNSLVDKSHHLRTQTDGKKITMHLHFINLIQIRKKLFAPIENIDKKLQIYLLKLILRCITQQKLIFTSTYIIQKKKN